MKPLTKQKIYCYADETGQDAGSDFFVVVVVISDQDQDSLHQELIEIEVETGVLFKWKKTALTRNKKYLQMVLQKHQMPCLCIIKCTRTY